MQHPVEAVELERPGAAGKAQDPRLAEAREEEQIPGIDRHPEMVDGAARRHDGGRHHVPAIDDGGRAGDEDGVAAAPVKLAHRFRHLGAAVGAADFRRERPVEPGEAGGDGAGGRIEDALAGSRQPRLDQADRARFERCEAQHRPALRRDRDAAIDDAARGGEGDHLDRRHHLAGLDQREGGNGAEGHGLVEQIEAVDPRRVDHGQPMGLGEDVAAAGKRRAERDPGAAERPRDRLGGLVLAHVVGLQAGAGDGLDPGLPQHRDVVGREHVPFLEGAARQTHAVGKDQPVRAGDRHLSEYHGPEFTSRRPQQARAASGEFA